MARQKSQIIINTEPLETPVLPAMVEDFHQLDRIEHQHEVTVRAIATQIGYQLPADSIDPDLIQRDISANMRRSVESCLEIGRGLIVLKEVCGHGNFIARLDVIGLDRKVAAKFMQAARKLSNVSSTRHLTKAIDSQTKLFEMLVLDDEQLEELELTGQTGELKLDDVATMSVKELRNALRKERQDAQAKDQVMSDKNTVIDKLAMQLNQREQAIQHRTKDEVIEELRTEAMRNSFEAEHAIANKLANTFRALTEHSLDNGGENKAYMLGLIVQIETEIFQVREEFGLHGSEIVVDDGTPEWNRPEVMAKTAEALAELEEKSAHLRKAN